MCFFMLSLLLATLLTNIMFFRWEEGELVAWQLRQDNELDPQPIQQVEFVPRMVMSSSFSTITIEG